MCKAGFVSEEFISWTKEICLFLCRHLIGIVLFALLLIFRRFRYQWFGFLLGWSSECQRHSSEWRSGNARFRLKQSRSTILQSNHGHRFDPLPCFLSLIRRSLSFANAFPDYTIADNVCAENESNPGRAAVLSISPYALTANVITRQFDRIDWWERWV